MRNIVAYYLVCFALVTLGCDGAIVGPGDAGSADASRVDASTGDPDGGVDAHVPLPPDAGLVCGTDQHACGSTCVDPMPDLPGTGCRLGCGEPCPGGANAICHDDGTCGIFGCEPMTCDELSVACGMADDGCGRRTPCGGCDAGLSCEAGACVCAGDLNEPNEAGTAATMIGVLTDDPDSSVSVTSGTIHHAGDEDWYQATVENRCCLGNPQITVRLSGLPAGEDYDLGAWYSCTDGDAPSCTAGTADASLASGGCTANAIGEDTVAFNTNCDSNGVLFVRVHAYSWSDSCAPYQLEVSVN